MRGRWKRFRTACKRAGKNFGQKLKTFFKEAEFPLLVFTAAAIAILLRGATFNSRSADYNTFLSVWFDQIKSEGIVTALGKQIGDYTPAYFYVLSILTLLPVNSLYSIKAVSCAFDILLAAFVGLCVKELTKSKTKGFLAYCATLFLPTVFLNSGSWAQCDSIYSSFCVMSVYYLLKKKNVTAILLYGVAFSFKLQAIFLAPLLAVLYFKRKIPLWSPLAVFGVYVLFCVPSWLCGRNFWSLLTIYFHQAGEYLSLTLNAPTLAALFGNVSDYHRDKLAYALIWLTAALTGLAVYLFSGKTEWKKESFVDLALLFALGLPFFLPRMHERYFYLADVCSVAYVFLHPKRAYTAILTEFCSFWVVGNYLFGMNYLSLGVVALLQLVNLLLLCRDLVKDYGDKTLSSSLSGEASSAEKKDL